MKKIAIGVVALFAVLLAALLIGPGFVDWNAYKDRIAAEVRAATGRDLTIAGDLSLALIPAPALSAAGVRLANLEGAGEEPMVALNSLRVRVALLPLLQGRIQVESIELIEPVIRLEVLADGRRNWDLAAAAPGEETGAAGGTTGAAPGLPGKVRLDSLRIREGTVIYVDAGSGRSERVEAVDAEIAAESLRGPFTAKGAANLRSVRLAFDLAVGLLRDEGATPINAELRMAEGGAAALTFSGLWSARAETGALTGRLGATSENLAPVLAALGAGAPPPALAQPFAFDAAVAADSSQVEVTELDLRLGDVSLTGQAAAQLGTPIEARVSLGVPQLDLDALLNVPAVAESGDAGDAPAAQSGEDTAATPTGAGVALPDGIAAELDVAIEALVYRGQVIRQVLLNASLAEGRLHLNQALALLPGGSDVALTGTLAPRGEGAAELVFDGRVEAASDNLRAVLDWLDVNVAEIPAGRLRRSSLTSRVEATTRQVTLREVDLRVDVSRVTGGVAIALRERPGLGIGLAVDQIDLDAYMPPPADSGAPGEGTPTEAGEAPAAEGAATAGPLAVLGRFDANFDLKVGRLAVQGMTARDLRLDATLQQGDLTVREASVADLAGGSARVDGTIGALAGTPTLDTAFALSVADPGRLAKVIGPQAEPLARLGAFEAEGRLRGTLTAPAFDASLQALGGRFAGQGEAAPFATPPSFDVALSASHPDVARLARSLNPDLTLGPGLGPLDLKGRVSGNAVTLRVSELDGVVGPLRLAGALSVGLGGPAPQVEEVALDLGLQHGDLGQLVRSLAPDSAAPLNLGPVELAARVTGSGQSLRATDLRGAVGPTEIAGTLGADFGGGKPRLTADLTTGELPLAALAAPAAGSGPSGSGGGQGATAQGGGQAGRWSREPIDLGGLQSLDADLKLKSEALIYEDLRLEDAILETALADGLLDLRRLDGRLFGGTLSLTGTLDARETPRMALTAVADQLDLGRLLASVAEAGRVSGPLSVNASLTATGRSQADLVSALAGSGDLNGTLKVTAKAEEQIGNLVLGILGQKVKEIRGVTDATNMLFNAFADAPAAVTGTFAIERGVLRTDDTRAEGRQATAQVHGTADLPAWQLDMRTDVYRAQDTAPFVTVDLRGPLDAPNPRIGGQVLQRQPEAPSAPVPSGPTPSGGGATPQPAPQPAPQTGPEELRPEDLLQDGLKGLLKGLGN